ncbi:DsbA family oxidoreductase [Paraburkholderia sp. J67]|uniref:DsbA family oxidoreductase n=1 Tax=Paraburkholderia sp. J67 TaxID=2805435 RepID=UPI002ABD6FAE|nr:DsbA family oxidoreductase [Paraburkholderia sp. J67]
MKELEISLTYDLICPWCWVADRRLKSAIAELRLEDQVSVKLVPYELNPKMPVDGLDRKAYRTAKFGSWARSQELDAHVAQVGRDDGLEFNYDRVVRTPNTLAGHRLIWLAQGEGKGLILADALFSAYFSEGKDIGDPTTLTEIAARNGMSAEVVAAFLASDEGTEEVRDLAEHAVRSGVTSVPSTRIGAGVISGAQPMVVFRDLLARAADVNVLTE